MFYAAHLYKLLLLLLLTSSDVPTCLSVTTLLSARLSVCLSVVQGPDLQNILRQSYD